MPEELESRWLKCKVIGKTTEQRGLLFKRSAYIIAIQIPGSDPPTMTFEGSFDQYCSVEIGKEISIEFYRTITDRWVASKEYAEYLNNLARNS